ncbi:MAG TPA: hydroxymethylglutaryl-CoA lyase [Acidimicrobiales bacterium]|nr:hydroxymethylglutaryl-CoA lyase [Acidimicrobiales bacterium]
MSTFPREVAIREVGPRDGLQAESPVSIETRVALIDALSTTGLRTIEAVSFVSEKAVPAMAGAAEVMAKITRVDGVAYIGLVPNLRGAQAAFDAGIDGLTVIMSASEIYSQKNTKRTIDESLDAATAISDFVDERVSVDVVISCAFGSPYEGDIAPEAVADIVRRAWDTGATAVTLADTTGMATPRRIDDVLDEVGTDVGLHLHETRGTALVNAYAALERGVARFDTSVGGLGGSPFAAGAAGNLATEDFVHLLDDLGIRSGVELAALLAVDETLAAAIGHPVASNIARAGPRNALV